MKLVPGTGSPPMPTHVVTPMPFCLQLVERLVGERARAAHDADRAARLARSRPAVMPMLHLPGLMMPGQFGPRSATCGKSRVSLL